MDTAQMTVVVQQIGEAVLASTVTVETMADRMNDLADNVQHQGIQIFALTDAVQTLAQVQDESLKRLDRLCDLLERFMVAIEQPPEDQN